MPQKPISRKSKARPTRRAARKKTAKAGQAACVYRRIVDDHEDGILIFDAETGRIVDVNASFARMLQCNRKEFLDGNIPDLFLPEDKAGFADAVAKLKRRKELRHDFLPLKAKDGKRIDATFSCRLIEVRNKPYVECIVHEKKKRSPGKDHGLQSAEQPSRELLDNISSCVVIYDAAPDGKDFIIKDFNRTVRIKEKITRKAVIGRSVLKVFPGIRDMGLWDVFERVWKTGHSEHYPSHHYADDKRQGWKDNYVTRLPSGELLVIYDDVTDQVLSRQALEQSEEKYRSMLESLEDGYYEVNLKGNLTFFNDALCRINGYSRQEMIGMNYRAYTGADAADRVFTAFHAVYKTGKPGKGLDYEITGKDGAKRFVDTSIVPIKDTNGAVVGFRGIVRDITARKNAEESLRESEERFRQAFSSTSDIIFILDASLTITSITPSVEHIIGYKPEELIGKRIDEPHVMTPESLARAGANTLEVLAGKPVVNAVYDFIAKDGCIMIGEVTASPIYKNGDVIGLIAIARDVTQRKQAEDALRQNEYYLRKSQEVAHMGSYEFDAKTGRWISSPILDQIFGLKADDVKDMNGWLDLIHPDDRDAMRLYLTEHVIRNKNNFEKEYRIIRRSDQETRWVYGMGELTFDENGQTDKMIGTIQDITERRRLEDEVLRSELKYRSIVENAQEGIFQILPGSRRLSVNPALAAMLGFASPGEAEQAVTNLPKQVYVRPDDYWASVETLNQEGRLSGFETEFYRKDKRRIWVNMSVSAVKDGASGELYYHGIIEDITEKKNLEKERQDSIDRLRKSLGATIRAMAATVETRDPYTAGHQRRVADLARAIATEMKLSRDQIDGIRLAGIIHDIGKISIPSEILTKPTRLTELEFELIKTHSESGYNILKDIEFPWPIARIVLEHHERIDGSGYPQGLKGEDILMESKIIAVADVVEAISSHRPYRPAFGMAPALDEITKNRGVIYDPDVVAACLKLFEENRYTMPE